MPSPVLALAQTIAASPFRVAPEAAAALDAFLRANDLVLEITDDPTVFAEVIPPRGPIRIGIHALDLLWAAAHSYLVLFDEHEKANRRGAELFEVGATTRTRSAFELYRWALEQYLSRTTSAWPSPSILPLASPECGTEAHATNELFLVAIAWIIHHEIAHVRLKHDNLFVRPIEEETAADKQATLWVCTGTEISSELQKRALGMATAILVLAACDLKTARTASVTHPLSFERLMLSLDHSGLAEDSKVFAFVYVLIQIHVAEVGEEFHRADGSFRDMCVDGCLEIRSLSQRNG